MESKWLNCIDIVLFAKKGGGKTLLGGEAKSEAAERLAANKKSHPAGRETGAEGRT